MAVNNLANLAGSIALNTVDMTVRKDPLLNSMVVSPQTTLLSNSSAVPNISLGISQLYNNTATPTVTAGSTAENIAKLANSVGTQEARIVAGAGQQIVEQYNEDEKKDDENFIMKVLNFLDAPRNALFNGVKYAVTGEEGGLGAGLWRGLTRKDEYTGTDLAEDLGIENGVGKFAFGLTAEVLLDPVNWVSFGASSVAKGFAQGAVKSASKEATEQMVKTGTRELAEAYIKEGAEQGAEAFLESGLRNASKVAATSTMKDVVNEAVEAGVKQTDDVIETLVKNNASKVDTILDAKGWTLGSDKVEAVYKEAYRQVSEVGKLYGNLSDDVLQLAAKGNYGDDIARDANNLMNLEKSLLGADDATKIELDKQITTLKDLLIKELNPYKNDIRLDTFKNMGIDTDIIRETTDELYSTSMRGGVQALRNKYGVATLADVRDELTKELGREARNEDLMLAIMQEGFGNKVMSGIPQFVKKNGTVEELKSWAINTLLDKTASDEYFNTLLRNGAKDFGTGLGLQVPFTNIKKEVVSANKLYELGARARTAISYRVTPNGITQTYIGRALDATNGLIGSLFGALPVIGNAFDETYRTTKANKWAVKFIENANKGQQKLAGVIAEQNIENYYRQLKDAGFKTSDDIEKVGNFISSAIESKQLPKNASIDDWKKIINDFVDMDETTINNKVNEELVNLQKQLAEQPDVVNSILNGSESIEEWYKTQKEAIKNRLMYRADIKSQLNSFTEAQQNAVLNVTQMMAKDFDDIGNTLADLGIITRDNLFDAEYWYYPHKMQLDILLDNHMDLNRKLTTRLGGRTQQFTLNDVSSYQRKYPLSTREVNRILENKYHIPNMLETNAFNTYLLYALDQGKVIADAEEVSKILNTFGYRVLDKNMIPTLREQHMNIVTRKSSVKAIMLGDRPFEALAEYNKLSGDLNEKYRQMKAFARATDKFKNNADNLLADTIKQNEAMVEAKKTLRELNKEAKAIVKDSDIMMKNVTENVESIYYVLKDANKIPDGMDEDVFKDVLDSIVNNNFSRKYNFYKTDSLGYVTMPTLAKDTVIKKDGVPYKMLGNPNNIFGGFRLAPDDLTYIPEGMDTAYILAKTPVDMKVDNLTEALESLDYTLSNEDLYTYISKGYDSIRFTDAQGNFAVVPFRDDQVVLTNKVKQSKKAAKEAFIDKVINTTDDRWVVPEKAFRDTNDEYITVSSISKGKKEQLSKIVDSYTKRNQERLNNYGNQLRAATKELDKALADKQAYEEAIEELSGYSLPTREIASRISNYKNRVENLTREIDFRQSDIARINKHISELQGNKYIQFAKGLSKNPAYKDAALTNSEFLSMFMDKEAAVRILDKGYDAIEQVTDTGNILYKPFSNIKRSMSKQDIATMFDVNINAIESVEGLSQLMQVLTDTGTGRDKLASLVESMMQSQATLQATEKYLRKVSNIDTKAISDFTKIQGPRALKHSTETTIADLLSSDGMLYVLDTDKKVDAIYDVLNINNAQIGLNASGYDVWALPQEIVEYFNKGVRKQADQGTALVKELMYKFNKIWKPSVTAWRPSFSTRNLASGYFNSWMELGNYVFDPDVTRAALNMARGSNLDEVVTFGNVTMTLGDLKKQMVLNGASNGIVVTDLNQMGEILANQLKRVTNKEASSIIRHPLKGMENLAMGVEDYNRSLAFLADLKRGDTIAGAADIVKKTQFDYGDLSEFESKIKKVFPFYTWLRKNLQFQIEKFLDNPGMYSILLKRVPEAAKDASGMSDEEWDNMPDWIKDSFPITLGKDETTGRYRLFDTTLPYQDLATISDVQGVAEQAVSLLHPLIKTPMELFLNKNLYTGAALESYEGETAEQAIQGTANPILNAIGKVAPELLRSMPGVTVTANQLLNTFGSTRDLKYLNNTKGTSKDGAVYGSRDVGATGNAFLNLIENALFDTNQMKYYSAEKGQLNKLYERQRGLSNLIQKLEDQGYVIPSSSDINKAAKMAGTTSAKGATMINTAISSIPNYNVTSISNVSSSNNGSISFKAVAENSLNVGGYKGIDSSKLNMYAPRATYYGPRNSFYPPRINRVKGGDKVVSFGQGYYTDLEGNQQEVNGLFKGSWGEETMKAEDGTVYREFITTEGISYFLNPNSKDMVAWEDSSHFTSDLQKYKDTYNKWKNMPASQRPSTWYALINDTNSLSPIVYNSLVLYNFDVNKVTTWLKTKNRNRQWVSK